MRKRRTSGKLTLHRETLRRLGPTLLRQAHGGSYSVDNDCSHKNCYDENGQCTVAVSGCAESAGLTCFCSNIC